MVPLLWLLELLLLLPFLSLSRKWQRCGRSYRPSGLDQLPRLDPEQAGLGPSGADDDAHGGRRMQAAGRCVRQRRAGDRNYLGRLRSERWGTSV